MVQKPLAGISMFIQFYRPERDDHMKRNFGLKRARDCRSLVDRFMSLPASVLICAGAAMLFVECLIAIKVVQ